MPTSAERNDEFVTPARKLYDIASREPIEAIPRGMVALDDTTEYLKRESFVQEFFAYETVGVVPAHVAPQVRVTREDNPELFAELDRQLADGRATITEDGELTFKEDEADTPLIVEDKK